MRWVILGGLISTHQLVVACSQVVSFLATKRRVLWSWWPRWRTACVLDRFRFHTDIQPVRHKVYSITSTQTYMTYPQLFLSLVVVSLKAVMVQLSAEWWYFEVDSLLVLVPLIAGTSQQLAYWHHPRVLNCVIVWVSMYTSRTTWGKRGYLLSLAVMTTSSPILPNSLSLNSLSRIVTV